jgi:hypothetical protein
MLFNENESLSLGLFYFTSFKNYRLFILIQIDIIVISVFTNDYIFSFFKISH